MTWTDAHGPDRLYDKFEVIRVKTGERIVDEFVFVLRPESDRSACVALLAYAEAVRHRSPHLAEQISERVKAIGRDNP